MIVEVKLANYRSIHAEQTLSFVAEKARRHPQNTIQRPGYRLLKAAALFGANASGKSNFVRAIGEMRDFVRDSATKMNDGDPIECAQPYRLDPESREKPSRFEIVFVTDGVQYTYGFAATRERVHEEWLTAKPEKGGKETLNIRRVNDGKINFATWKADGNPDELTNLLLDRTRSNALFLSTAARENVKELRDAYRYISSVIGTGDATQDMTEVFTAVAARYEEDDELYQLAQTIVCDADTGMDSFSIKAGLVNSYRRDIQGNTVKFDFREAESEGTQRLFALVGVFLHGLRHGLFLAMDELDNSMHPLLTRRLLEMFQSTQANPNGAQLLFTTHDAVLLDSVLFRRDQIILAEKQGNESRFYSLADIVPPPRNDKLFLHSYLAGRFGATPYLGRAFDDIAVEGAK